MVSNLKIEEPLGNSDHATIKFDLNCYMAREPPKLKVLYHKGNYTKMKDLLDKVEWEKEFKKYPNNVNEKWKFFKTTFHNIQEKCVPTRMVYVDGKLSKNYQCH